MLELVDLTAAANRRAKGYSLGMKQRLSLAGALLGDPQVLVLDEPANGLDPQGIRWLRDLLRSLAHEGRTVLVSSHVLTEMAQLADDVVIIAKGRLVTQAPMADVLAGGGRGTRVRSPERDRLAAALERAGVEAARPLGDDALGVEAPPAKVGEVAAAEGIVLHELVTDVGVARGRLPRADRGGEHAGMRLLSSELLKLRTIRTSYLLLLGSAAISAIAAAGFVGSGSVDRGDDDPALALGQGASFGTLFAAVLGILIVTNEYRHGTIMTTFLAEPRRISVLLAKLAAAAIVGARVRRDDAGRDGGGRPAVARGTGTSRCSLNGQVLEAVGRSLLVFGLTAVIGAAVGAIVQSQVGAIVGYFIWIFVVESLVIGPLGLVFTDIGDPDPISKFLPGSSLSGIVGGEGSEFVLRGGTAALLALGYAIGLSVLGALSIHPPRPVATLGRGRAGEDGRGGRAPGRLARLRRQRRRPAERVRRLRPQRACRATGSGRA